MPWHCTEKRINLRFTRFMIFWIRLNEDGCSEGEPLANVTISFIHLHAIEFKKIFHSMAHIFKAFNNSTKMVLNCWCKLLNSSYGPHHSFGRNTWFRLYFWFEQLCNQSHYGVELVNTDTQCSLVRSLAHLNHHIQ